MVVGCCKERSYTIPNADIVDTILSPRRIIMWLAASMACGITSIGVMTEIRKVFTEFGNLSPEPSIIMFFE